MNIYSLKDIQSLTNTEQYFNYSDAYLSAAEVLCLKICHSNINVSYADGAVIMSLTFHAEELFLKAAISKREPTFKYGKKGHDLVYLNTKFVELFPDNKFRFNLIFNRRLPTAQELSETYKIEIKDATELLLHTEKHNADLPEDQLHRYPFSKDNNAWRALLGFEPHSFLDNIKQLKRELKNIKILILSND